MGYLLPVKLERISEELMHPKKREKKCVCHKDRHKSKGAAESQVRALKRLQTLPDAKKDIKNPNKLQAYRSRQCERAIGDGFEVWHAGHR